MKMKKGMTLIEVIVALALVGIISLGLVTPIVAQYGLMNRTKGITTDVFEIQQQVEDRLYEVRRLLVPAGNIQIIADAEKDTVATVKFDGKDIKMYKMDMEFNENEAKTVSMFLSQKLAQNEKSSAVKIDEVWIKGTDKTTEVISNTADTSKLEAMITEDENEEKYTTLYKWYVSKEGISEPVSLENDYELIDLSVASLKSNTLNELKKYPNKYIVVSVTPVDIHGRRGNEKFSSNRAYIRGEEWRAGTFAWVDQDRDGVYEVSDYTLIKQQKLLEPLDTDKFLIYGHSSEIETKKLDAGYLFVPQRLQESGPFNIIAKTTNMIDWRIKNGIYLSNDIKAENLSDVKLTTVDGNIVLYTFAKINSSGAAVIENGKTALIEDGSRIESDKDIYLTAGGKGNILLQRFSSLIGENIILNANGKAELYKSTVTAKKTIDIDTTKSINILTARDIKLDETVIKIQDSSDKNKIIRLNSRDDISLTKSTVTGNKSAVSFLDIYAKGKAIIDQTLLESITVNINTDTEFSEGKIGSSSRVILKDDFSVTFKKLVDNAGSVEAGDKGKLIFEPSLAEALKNELKIQLAGNSNRIEISTNYGRNIGLAQPISEETDLSESFKAMGTGSSNLEYSVTGSIPMIDSVNISFDGENMLTISAIASGKTSGQLTITVRDKYTSPQITAVKKINISCDSETGGPATVQVVN